MKAAVARALPAAGRGDRDRGRAGDHHRQDPGGVRAGLSVHIRPEDDRDQNADGRVHQDDGAHGPAPLRGHPVAGQVTRHDVDQPRHRRGPGEPQNQDAADVVGGPEPVTELGVGEIGQGPAVGLSPVLELLRRDQDGGDEAGGEQVHAHDQRRGGQQLAGVGDPRCQALFRSLTVGGDQRHHGHAGLEPGQAQHE